MRRFFALLSLALLSTCMHGAPALAQMGSSANPMNTMADPSRHASAITPSDSTVLTGVRALYVGTTGDIAMIGVDAPSGATGVLFKAVPAGVILPFSPRQVLATGTTASNIVGLK